MDINPLKTFVLLAKEGHMTRAASRLHRTQPAISAQLSKLEQELGQRLFDRTPKGMILTAAGRLFLQHVEVALEHLEAGKIALEKLAGLEQGSLSIGGGATATTYLLPSLLARFHLKYPKIRFFVREQGSQNVVKGILHDKLDFGVVTMPLVLGKQRAQLVIEPWVEDELRLIVPPGSPLSKRESFAWRDLDRMPFVLFEGGSAVRTLIDQRVERAAIHVEPVMELRSIESIKQMVAQGIGAAFVSRFALDAPNSALRCQEQPITRSLAIIYRKDRTQSPATRAFLQMMRETSGL